MMYIGKKTGTYIVLCCSIPLIWFLVACEVTHRETQCIIYENEVVEIYIDHPPFQTLKKSVYVYTDAIYHEDSQLSKILVYDGNDDDKKIDAVLEYYKKRSFFACKIHEGFGLRHILTFDGKQTMTHDLVTTNAFFLCFLPCLLIAMYVTLLIAKDYCPQEIKQE